LTIFTFYARTAANILFSATVQLDKQSQAIQKPSDINAAAESRKRTTQRADNHLSTL
jgi:hypothetical protein